MKKIFLTLLMLPALTIAHEYQIKPKARQNTKHVLLDVAWGKNSDIIVRVDEQAYSVNTTNIDTILRYHRQELMDDLVAMANQLSDEHYTPDELNALRDAIQKALVLAPACIEDLMPLIPKYTKDLKQKMTAWQGILTIFANSYKQRILADLTTAATQFSRRNYAADELEALYALAMKAMKLIPEFKEALSPLVLVKLASNQQPIESQDALALQVPSSTQELDELIAVLFKFLEENFTDQEINFLFASLEKANTLIPEVQKALVPLIIKYRDELMQKLKQGRNIAEPILREYKDKILRDMGIIVMAFVAKNYTKEEIDFVITSGMKTLALIPELKDALAPLIVKYCAKAECEKKDTSMQTIKSEPAQRANTVSGIRKQQQYKVIKLNKLF